MNIIRFQFTAWIIWWVSTFFFFPQNSFTVCKTTSTGAGCATKFNNFRWTPLFFSRTFYKILVTCCILSKSKQGRWGRCIRWFICLICLRLGDTEQWNNFAGGLIDCTSIEIFGLSQEIFIFSRLRPQSLSINGVFERYIIVPRCGFSASIGGDVRKFTTGAGIFSK